MGRLFLILLLIVPVSLFAEPPGNKPSVLSGEHRGNPSVLTGEPQSGRSVLSGIDPAELSVECPTPDELCAALSGGRNNARRIATPAVVTKFYECLARMHGAKTQNELFELQVEAESCFYASKESGLRLTVDGIGEMTSNLYVQTVSERLFKDRTTYIDYSIDCSEIGGADSSYCVTYVSKILVEGDRTTPYRDILFTKISNPDLIVGFHNTKAVNIKSLSQLLPSLTPDLIAGSSTDMLKSWSENYYTMGLYEDAEKCFSELLRRNPNDRALRARITAKRMASKERR